MSNLLSLVDGNNKLKYAELKEYVLKTPLVTFMSETAKPFLIGKELFVGDMSKQTGGSDTSTMRFSIADIQQQLGTDTQETSGSPVGESAISRAVFILNKGADSYETRLDVFTIGRASSNDITIADYVISKQHAAIHAAAGHFFVEDLGSTNGVKINGESIAVGEKVQIPSGAEISFGRFCFMFVQPIELFNKVKKEVMGR